MRKLPFLIALFCFSTFYSQNWINQAGGNSNDECYDVVVDASGNIYSTGYVTGATTFGTTLNLTTNGYSDIYVSKSDANGNFIWAKTFGGSSADRGFDIALDASDNILITGYFNGTALFDGFTITASGSSQDLFIAKLDNSGNVIWVISEGGTDAETGFGIATDDAGNVVVIGQYRGTTSLAGNTFISKTDPVTNIQSFDFFVAKYSPSGAPLWSLNGASNYDNKGLAVKVDHNNNILVSGQFSDTLSFASTQINNTIYNAGMVFQLSPTGSLNWFKKLGAFQCVAYDLEFDANNNVYVTGEYQGNLIVFDTPNFSMTGSYTYHYFVLKFNNLGHVVWGETISSENKVSSKAIALDANEDVYITGTFNCQLTDYSDSLGGAYFNSVGYEDVFMAKFLNNGTPSWFRQYGGPQRDYCSGIAISQVDNPVLGGSFDRYFNFPFKTFIFSNILSGLGMSNNNGYSIFPYPACNFSQPSYHYLESHRSLDVFVGKLYNSSLSHYSYNLDTQAPNNCGVELAPCFRIENNQNCHDSILNCGDLKLYYWPHTAGNGLSPDTILYKDDYSDYTHHNGPYWDFNWTSVSDSLDFIIVDTTGTYMFEGGRKDHCDFYADSVYVQINPFPNMLELTDDHNANMADTDYVDIYVCSPDTVNLIFNQTDTSDTFTILFPDQSVYTDSLIFNTSQLGDYNITVATSFGCTKNESFEIITEIMPVLDTIVPYMMFTNASIQGTDTVVICEGDPVEVRIYDSLTNPNGDVTQWFSPTDWWSSTWNYGTNLCPVNLDCIGTEFYATSSGWYTFNTSFTLGDVNLCGGDTLTYYATDTYYILVNPLPVSYAIVNGISPFCPGEISNIWTTQTHPGGVWNGAGILSSNATNDSIFANIDGNYMYSYALLDTLTGCGATFNPSFDLIVKQAPEIVSNTPDNIICPYDSILLSAPFSLAYQWVGPQGNILDTTQTIYVDVVGFYHCIITDMDMCQMTSNTIELLEYSTPFLIANPDTELCHSGAVDLSIEHSGAPSFSWINPSGITNPDITVTQPGTYICEISQCGFTVTDSITITLSTFQATIIALTDTIICPNDTVLLLAGPNGNYVYQWNGGLGNSNIAQATQEGVYNVTVYDQHGCSATSNTIEVSYFNGSNPPLPMDTTICFDDDISISILGYNQLDWYDANYQWLYTGNNLQLNNVQNDTVFYITNSDTNCTSNYSPITIQINQTSIIPSIMLSDSSVCEGENLTLYSDSPNYTHLWTTPNGSISSVSNLVLNNLNSYNSGIYYLSISDLFCSSPTDSIILFIHPLPDIQVGFMDTTICENDSVQVNISASDSIQINNGIMLSQNYSEWFSSDQNFSIVSTSYFGCTSQSNIDIIVQDLPISPVVLILDTTHLCAADSLVWLFDIDANNTYNFEWNSVNISIGDTLNIQGDSLQGYNYLITTTSDAMGCLVVDTNTILAYEVPVLTLNDTIICEGSTFDILLTTVYKYLWQNGSTTNNYMVSDSGLYTVIVTNGPCSISESFLVTTMDCKPQTANVFSPNGDGQNDVFEFVTGELKSGELIIFNRWGKVVYEQTDGVLKWNGINYSSNKDASEGTYYYLIKGENINGTPFQQEGWFSLFR